MIKTLALPTGFNIGPLHIQFYALFIIGGALLALFIAKHQTKKMGYNPKALDNLFYVAFGSGIIGARVWFVIAEWGKRFANQPFYKVFAIWEGGLAIQGGIIFGVIAGVWFMLKYRPSIPLFKFIDVAAPGILLAQAIGRWGNFFNQEVYGACVRRSEWSFLPDFILDQMAVCSGPDQIAVPLFLIEAVVNTIGFFVLFYGIRVGLKKWVAPGVAACSYLVWYGVVRLIMEPLRNQEFIMGEKLAASQLMAGVFVVVGVLAIILMFVIDKKTKPKKQAVEANFNNYLEYQEKNPREIDEK